MRHDLVAQTPDRLLERNLGVVLGNLLARLADVHASPDAQPREVAAEVLDDVEVGVGRGDADAQVVLERAHRQLDTHRRGQDVDVADIGGEPLVDAYGAQVRHGRRGVVGSEAVGKRQHEVLEEQRGEPQKRVLLELDHAVHAQLEVLGVDGCPELVVHLLRYGLDGLVLPCGVVGHEHQAEEVLRRGRLEVLAQIDRNVDADGPCAVALGHLVAERRDEHGHDI